MNSKEALEKLLKENEDARDRFKKLGGVPQEEKAKELQRFEKEFGIELREEDFADEELDNEQLEGVAGGADAMDSGLGSAFMIYSTNRMPQGGGQRMEVKGSVKHKGGRKYEPIKEIL